MRGGPPLPVAVLVGGTVGAASATFPVGDSDLYWHLATARETLAHGLVRSEIFSWTASGAPMSLDQWAGQLLLYAGYLAGGWAGVLSVRTVAVALLVGLIAAAALARSQRGPVAAVAIAIPAILLTRFIWTERPELFGAVCFAALVLLLQLEGEAPLFAIAPLLVVWANLHGSFALGAALVLLVSAQGLARDGARRRGHLVAIAGALASLVATPAGLATLTSPGLHLLDPPREIQEWALPDLATMPGAVWALVLGAVLACACLAPRARPRDVLVIVPVALLSLVAIRHAPLLAIAATPYLAEHLPIALRRLMGLAIEAPTSALRVPSGALGAAVVVGAAALLVGAMAVAPRDVDERGFPVAALERLPAGPGLFAQYDWGGWLIWRAPATPVFVDGRLVPYRGPVLRDYRAVLEARPGWRDVVAGRGVRWILVRPGDPVAVRALDLGWPVLSRSPDHVLIEVPSRP